jgi:hypothetical protein
LLLFIISFVLVGYLLTNNCLLQAREKRESATVLFNQTMELILEEDRWESFWCAEKAAEKGHEEARWIWRVMRGTDVDSIADLKEYFAERNDPLGWFLEGVTSDYDSMEQLNLFKKSAEAGCSWGQALYADCIRRGKFAEVDPKECVTWLEKAINQNNPLAMHRLGEYWSEGGGDEKTVLRYYRAAADLGWKESNDQLSSMSVDGNGTIDLRQGVVLSAKGTSYEVFNRRFMEAVGAFNFGGTKYVGYDEVCYTLGWGLFWHVYVSDVWNALLTEKRRLFGNYCMEFYISCVELQGESIFTFLLCWNRTMGGKVSGKMIAQMVWEGRADNLVKSLEASEPELKKIKA